MEMELGLSVSFNPGAEIRKPVSERGAEGEGLGEMDGILRRIALCIIMAENTERQILIDCLCRESLSCIL